MGQATISCSGIFAASSWSHWQPECFPEEHRPRNRSSRAERTRGVSRGTRGQQRINGATGGGGQICLWIRGSWSGSGFWKQWQQGKQQQPKRASSSQVAARRFDGFVVSRQSFGGALKIFGHLAVNQIGIPSFHATTSRIIHCFSSAHDH
ncbi:uncharacterized protein LOC9649740 [Selaginella moellendorffii]|uniref:uncharacterized protein LOC9649740 n=1 Tax=Selaginella moellendorffii TaxID=88036 RepID=UPI000D1CDFAA|nr:uncharacterized protein LOC9649740 [Selaginella moellendorffii]XP_024537450.1 uncharacterized protein LOC9649740 [Selaginella moellendorffii]XP_024537451.1 uncharacterized protein LOC9649740 [Selaginella moellendorffii]|eukprot:XP_024537449.1 uncharacterized protein LOC9649740 [Selaginella moellendorffii]